MDGTWATPNIPIEKGTWLAFGKSPGDHRDAVLDIKWEVLLGEAILKVERPPARRLATSNPAATTKYRTLASAHFRRHHLLRRLHKLYKEAGPILNTREKGELERIDRLKREGMQYAEKRCRKLAMGHIDFSPPLDEARDLRNLWQAVVRKRQGKRVSTTWIRRCARRCLII